MAVSEILGKLADHNHEVLGAAVAKDGMIVKRMVDQYEIVDVEGMAERAEGMLALSKGLEDAAGELSEVFLEMQHHSFYARSLTNGTLIVIGKPMGRNAFKKVRVGVNLFLKPLERALASEDMASHQLETVEAPVEEPAAAETEAAPKKPVRYYRGVRY